MVSSWWKLQHHAFKRRRDVIQQLVHLCFVSNGFSATSQALVVATWHHCQIQVIGAVGNLIIGRVRDSCIFKHPVSSCSARLVREARVVAVGIWDLYHVVPVSTWQGRGKMKVNQIILGIKLTLLCNRIPKLTTSSNTSTHTYVYTYTQHTHYTHEIYTRYTHSSTINILFNMGHYML